MKFVVTATYVDRDCQLFVWANPSVGVQVIATSEVGAAREFFGPEAFVSDDSAFEAGFVPESRIGRFVPGSEPIDRKAFDAFALGLVREQHG